MPFSKKFPAALLAVILHNGLTKVISVVVAIILWVVVLGSRSTEVTKDIPLEILTSDELVVASEVPDRISFRMVGPKAFMRTIMDRRETPIRVNLSGAKAGVAQYRFTGDNVKLPLGVKIIGINPPAISVMLEPLRSRHVPVKLDTRGFLPKGYQLVRSEVIPPTVRVKGSKSRVAVINEILTSPIDLSELRQPIHAPAQLDLAKWGVELDEAAPLVHIEVRPTAANFRIRNVAVKVLSEYPSRYKVRTVTALVQASPEALRTLDQRQVFAEIDLRGKPRGVYKGEVQVRLPPQIGLVRSIPESVEVTLY